MKSITYNLPCELSKCKLLTYSEQLIFFLAS